MRAARMLVRGRRLALDLMHAHGSVWRANGGTETDPITHEERPTFDLIYAGPCRVRMPSATTPRTASIPGQTAVLDRAFLSFPLAATSVIQVGDEWECTENPFDPELVGQRLRVAGAHIGTATTARRFPVEEMS